MVPNSGDWNEWEKYILSELKRLNENDKIISDKLDDVRMKIIELKIKAGIWGALAGAIPSMVAVILLILRG